MNPLARLMERIRRPVAADLADAAGPQRGPLAPETARPARQSANQRPGRSCPGQPGSTRHVSLSAAVARLSAGALSLCADAAAAVPAASRSRPIRRNTRSCRSIRRTSRRSTLAYPYPPAQLPQPAFHAWQPQPVAVDAYGRPQQFVPPYPAYPMHGPAGRRRRLSAGGPARLCATPERDRQPRPTVAAREMSPIEEVRESLREFRDAIRDLTESRAPPVLLTANSPAVSSLRHRTAHMTGLRRRIFVKMPRRSARRQGRAMAEIIDGKAVGDDVVATVKALTAELLRSGGRQPGLAVVIVGEDPASQVYVASKSRKAKECGFHSRAAHAAGRHQRGRAARAHRRPQRRPGDRRHPGAAAAARPHRFRPASSRRSRRKRTSTASISSMSASSAPANWKPPSCPARRPARCC